MKILADDFNLAATLESGQVFGFERKGEVFEGAFSSGGVRLWQEGKTLSIESDHAIESAVVRYYFDLDRDLESVYAHFKEDPKLKPLLKLKGLRLIRQDSWEALACFIISSNNNVKRIQGIWKNLADHFSPGQNGDAPFPAASQIARSHERILRGLGLGYRAPFLLSTATFIASTPESLGVIRDGKYKEAFDRVISFPGIGPKVADCVLLYGFHKLEAFPVDVWIERIIRKLYFHGRRVSPSRIQSFGQKRWGPLAGYVQQYLFHAARTGLI